MVKGIIREEKVVHRQTFSLDVCAWETFTLVDHFEAEQNRQCAIAKKEEEEEESARLPPRRNGLDSRGATSEFSHVIGGFSRGYAVSPGHAFQRCSVSTPLHLSRLSRLTPDKDLVGATTELFVLTCIKQFWLIQTVLEVRARFEPSSPVSEHYALASSANLTIDEGGIVILTLRLAYSLGSARLGGTVERKPSLPYKASTRHSEKSIAWLDYRQLGATHPETGT
ncbi:hypothetical protein PR048_028663 [Dryococelus australis]|uniref:Uncharacterized protein n=1 Tax=Dryococelus australis TaxID=614101 RepID=A0ABQ9GB76_9NEOP|nr:hypothetical protein PR048_028663 [Dryococelus australis]